MVDVTIVQRILPHYRVALFSTLAELLETRGVRLRVLYGQEQSHSVPRSLSVEDAWAIRVENRYWMHGRLVWQPWLPLFHASDLNIAEHANSLALAHRLVWHRVTSQRGRLAFWGHGCNLRARPSVRENYKQWLARHVDWWFAYTDPSADTIAAAGFPRDRITVVNNSTEVRCDDDAHASVGSNGSPRVAIFCGGLYADKRLDFLVAACRAIRKRLPDFELIVIGEGPSQGVIEAAAAEHAWIHYVGPRYGNALVPYLRRAQVCLMPGLVGLAVIDSFAAGVPMVTTDLPIHSPEIAYLESGVNGLVMPNTLEDYVEGVCALLSHPSWLQRLRAGCAQAARRYSLSAMAQRYAEGIDHCLSQERRRSWRPTRLRVSDTLTTLQ